jgi:hypothetical protein
VSGGDFCDRRGGPAQEPGPVEDRFRSVGSGGVPKVRQMRFATMVVAVCPGIGKSLRPVASGSAGMATGAADGPVTRS